MFQLRVLQTADYRGIVSAPKLLFADEKILEVMMKISRRDFIKACGASAALASVGATIAPPSLEKNLQSTPIYANTGNGILIDTSRDAPATWSP